MELQVGVKIILQNKEGKFLLLQRNPEKYPEVGAQWEIAGGRIDPGVSLMENLKREVMEETGLEISGEQKLIAAQDILKKDRHVVRLTYVGTAEGEVKLSDEHSGYKWLTADEVRNQTGLDPYSREVFAKFILK